MILAYIDSHRERFGFEPIHTELSKAGVTIAPSTYHAHKRVPLTEAALEDAYTANALYTLWEENWKVYGARKLHIAARRAGIEIGRDQVARLMRLAGIADAVRGRHRTRTTVRDETAPRHPDLVKRAWRAPTRQDELWVADFSYVWTLQSANGRVYRGSGRRRSGVLPAPEALAGLGGCRCRADPAGHLGVLGTGGRSRTGAGRV
ncbi:MAG: IS3 family transposase [Dermatophilaceae bacterium]